MGYDLHSQNTEIDSFHFGAFSFPILLEACNYLWPCIYTSGRWYRVLGVDRRFVDEQYPELLSMDGFEVTEEEAHIMARIARNFVAVQRSLPETNRGGGPMCQDRGFTREDVMGLLVSSLHDEPAGRKWPVKIRDDFVDRFEKFAHWAEQSGGFAIR